MKILRRVVFCLLAMSGAAPFMLSAAGLAVYPMEQFVRPGRPAIYNVSNTQTQAIAVEVTVELWTISEEGEEIREPSNDLIVFPAQFILKGHTSRRLKVGTRSKRKLDQEVAYRVTIRELPVSFQLEESTQNRVYMANSYRTSFYVEPTRREADVALVESAVDGSLLRIRLKNPGTVHTHLLQPELKITTADGTVHSLEDEDILDAIAGQNLHAGRTREFVVDMAKIGLKQPVKEIRMSVENARHSKTLSFDLLGRDAAAGGVLIPMRSMGAKEPSSSLAPKKHPWIALKQLHQHLNVALGVNHTALGFQQDPKRMIGLRTSDFTAEKVPSLK